MSAIIREIYHHGVPGAGTFDLLKDASNRNCAVCNKRRKTGVLVRKVNELAANDVTVAASVCMECAKRQVCDFRPPESPIAAGRAAEGSG